MRVLLVNRYYGGTHVPTGRMLHDLARCLHRLGHQVRVLTTREVYVSTDRSSAGDDPSASVQALWVGGGRSRALSWLLFWTQVCLRLPFMRWDRCVLLTDPPFMPMAAWLARLVRSAGRKVYWWTMDLFPECMVANGMLRPRSGAHYFLRSLNELGIGALAGAVSLGDQQRKLLESYRRWPDRQDFCRVVPPWDYRPLREVRRSENRFLAAHGWMDKRVALYAGNLGQQHTYRDLVAAARELNRRGDREWIFAFVCRGTNRPALEADCAGMDNVAVLDYLPPDQTADLLWAADVHLITMTDGWQGIVVPSKLYGALQTRAPVLFVGPRDDDTADQIRRYRAGLVLPGGCGGSGVAEALEELQKERYRKPKEIDRRGAERVADFVTRRS